MKHYIGTFRVYAKNTTIWKEGMNRSVDKSKDLEESMAAGIWRTEPKNRITGIVDRKDLRCHIHRSFP